jgi:hypothetical protein
LQAKQENDKMKKHEDDFEMKTLRASVALGISAMIQKTPAQPRCRGFVTTTDEPWTGSELYDLQPSIYLEAQELRETIDLGQTVLENDLQSDQHALYGTHIDETDIPQSLL